MVDVLFLALVAMASGAGGADATQDNGEATAGWFADFLGLRWWIPSQDTFPRVFALLSTATVERLFLDWVHGLRTVREGGRVDLDGKTVRRSFDTASRGEAIHVVSTWPASEGLVLGQGEDR